MFTLALAAPLAQAQAPAPVEKTGQTSCYSSTNGALIGCFGTGVDGELRPGVAWPSPRFADNGDGTVTDELTGLIWLKNADCFGIQHWGSAVSVVKSLGSGLCGLSDSSVAGDWRLPSVKELESLLAYGYTAPALSSASGLAKWQEGDAFSHVRWSTTSGKGGYWSSTSLVQSTGAWLVSFYTGNVWADYKENPGIYAAESHYVWPVRGGDLEPLPVDNEPPIVSLTSPSSCSSLPITVAATASDNVAVAGVQFQVDGQNLAAEDTQPPYETTWATTAWGCHTFSAIARDSAGNQASSSRRTMVLPPFFMLFFGFCPACP